MVKRIIILLIFALLFGCSKNFIIKNIHINGIKNANPKAVMKIVNSIREKNLFSVNMKKLQNQLQKIPYIKEALILKKPPSTIFITIKEYGILGHCKLDKEYLILENGNFVASHKLIGPEIRFDKNTTINKKLKNYLAFFYKNKNLLNRAKTIYIKQNFIIIVEKNNFIIKMDKKLNGIKFLKYTNAIKKHIPENIKGLDLRFNNMAILITEG